MIRALLFYSNIKKKKEMEFHKSNFCQLSIRLITVQRNNILHTANLQMSDLAKQMCKIRAFLNESRVTFCYVVCIIV